MPFLGERVGMTEATRLHFDSDLSRPGLRNLSLDHLKRSTRATHLDDAHLGHTHQTFIPPSTTMSAPVTYELSSDARRESVRTLLIRTLLRQVAAAVAENRLTVHVGGVV